MWIPPSPQLPLSVRHRVTALRRSDQSCRYGHTVLQFLAGVGVVVYGVYMIATARRTSARKGDRRFLGYPSHSIANIRLVGTGFCLIGIVIAASALGFWG